MPSNKFNLIEFFKALERDKYVIIKYNSKLSCYVKGSDVDIFCTDGKKVAKNLFAVGNKYLSRSSNYKIIINEPNKGHFHIDFLYKEGLEIRFDIYSKLPNYKKVAIKSEFFNLIIDQSVRKKISSKCYVKIASPVNEQVVRYLEYLEYYKSIPGKTKHLEYLKRKLRTKKDRDLFSNRLHLLTSISKKTEKQQDKATITKYRKSSFKLNLLKLKYYNLYRIQKKLRSYLNSLIYNFLQLIKKA